MNPTNKEHLEGFIAAIEVMRSAENQEAVFELMAELGKMVYLWTTKQGPYWKRAHSVEYQRQGEQL